MLPVSLSSVRRARVAAALVAVVMMTAAAPAVAGAAPARQATATPARLATATPASYPITSGKAVGVPAGDYLLTMTVTTSASVPVAGIVAQYPGGIGTWNRVADFHATQTPSSVSAEVRVTDPSDVFVPFGAFAAVTATNLVMTAANWDYVVRGQDIVAKSGAKAIWHGVNASESWAIPNEVDLLHNYTHTNIIRVPIFEEQWLPYFTAEYTPGYRQHIIDTVNAITADGMTAIVLLTSAGHDDPAFNLGVSGTGQLAPDQQSIAFWKDAAALWASTPNVIFELFNEPQLRSSDPEPGGLTGAQVWRDGGTLTTGSYTWTAPGMQQLVNVVRGTGAANLVIVDGPGWAGDLTPVEQNPIDATNLVYGFHAYTSPGEDPTIVPAHLANLVAPLMDPKTYRYATLATEFGTTVQDTQTSSPGSQYLASTISWIAAHGAGWLVWGWYPTSYDQYGLLWSLPMGMTGRSGTVYSRM